MKELRKLYPENSKPVTIDLKKKNLKDSDNIISKLEMYKDTLVNLDLSGNALTCLSSLELFPNLKFINLTNNPLDLENLLPNLAANSNLIDLKINLTSQNDVLAILTSLPNLIYLNGKPTKDETIDLDDKDILNISMNTEISTFNNTFNIINDKIRTVNKGVTKDFFNEFQNILKTEIDKINQSVDNSVPNYIYATNVVSSKLKLYKYFTDKFLDFMEVTSEESANIVRDLYEKIKVSTDTLVDIIYSLYPRIEEKTKSLKSSVEQSGKDNNLISNELLAMEEKLIESNKEKDAMMKKFKYEKEMYIEKIETLEKENKMITDKLIKSAKNLISENTENTKTNYDITPKNTNKKNQSSINHTSGNNFFLNKSPQNYTHVTENNQNHTVPNKRGENCIQFSQNGEMRVFTKKMLLDIIAEIYESKRQYDLVNIENKMPNETLEQHMYSYLNQKYGLKNLIIEWATTIINGLKTYSSEESDILLFGKILRNEIEENARLVLDKLKSTIVELLEHFLKTKNLLRSRDEVKEELKQKITGMIQEEEWKGIIYYIYEHEDANFIENKIIDFIKKKYSDAKLKEKQDVIKLSREELQKISNYKEDNKILFKDFQKILLDFQIKSREKYIKNFLTIFKEVDIDNNGIISEEEFIRLTMSMNVYNSNINENIMRLLNIIDPCNNKQITFSDCVKLFSNEILVQDDMNGNKMSINILDKICIDEN